MKKKILLYTTFLGLAVLVCILVGIVINNSLEKAEIDSETENIIRRANELAERYKNLTKEQVLKRKGVLSSEKRGTYAESVRVSDEETGEQMEFWFYHGKVDIIICMDDKGHWFDLRLDYDDDMENPHVRMFAEGDPGTQYGILAFFYDSKRLRSLFHIKDRKLIGRALWWDESGKLVKKTYYKEPQPLFQVKGYRQIQQERALQKKSK